MKERFDYRRFEAGRERLANATFGFVALWWAALLAIGVGASWSESLAGLKDATVWGVLTVDRLLAIGAGASTVIAIGGPWMLRNLRRPPQLFVVLRDFQSRTAAQVASNYVRRHGGRWGFWLTLENADLRAADSVGGEVEIDPEDAGDASERLPIGSWWLVSVILGFALSAASFLVILESPVVVWMRERLGSIPLGVLTIAGFCISMLAATVVIRWLLLTLQRAVVLPGRVDSAETFESVVDTVVSRVRRRATTLTLGPMPVVSVDDAWWQKVVARCIDEASLVVFLLAERESTHLTWEIDHVRQRFDPRRTLFIELAGDGLRLRDGAGHRLAATPLVREAKRIEEAVRGMLLGDDA